MREIPHHFDFRMIVIVDFCWQEVSMHNILVLVSVPQVRMILDHIITKGDNQVSGVQRVSVA